MGKIMGIDRGTTDSVVAAMEGSEPKVIPNEEGARTAASVVAGDDRGEVLVGPIAKHQAGSRPRCRRSSAGEPPERAEPAPPPRPLLGAMAGQFNHSRRIGAAAAALDRLS